MFYVCIMRISAIRKGTHDGVQCVQAALLLCCAAHVSPSHALLHAAVAGEAHSNLRAAHGVHGT